MTFSLEGTDASIANALRRVMIAETPTVAIHFVRIENNTSPLNDEMLSHRLGLIPIVYRGDVRQLNSNRDCDCQGNCARCSVEFELHVRNDGEDTIEVTSHDLRALSDMAVPLDDETLPRGILICKLGKFQEIRLTAIATKGVGKEHAKWSPVSTAVFQYEPSIRLNYRLLDELSPQDRQNFVGSCPARVFEIQDGRVVIPDVYRCTYTEECMRWAEQVGKPDLVTVKQLEPPRFRFSVETTGSLKPAEIVQSCLITIQEKIRKIEDLLVTKQEEQQLPQ
ncbi:putative DNA-directed RNA polymerase II subunit rpb3 [Paratrimastix pyriformis]|uniref:DNA-directed RNA polymerase II subunit rpb3 n=1 Tax=Paratrimastix pyriformis TaxID=342808 RepID=A0ABQ8UV80_9EUKA|nr:putative DNA-directed RNA polymerase II subunit rpb3 [Paratrimastix pyriformis]